MVSTTYTQQVTQQTAVSGAQVNDATPQDVNKETMALTLPECTPPACCMRIISLRKITYICQFVLVCCQINPIWLSNN